MTPMEAMQNRPASGIVTNPGEATKIEGDFNQHYETAYTCSKVATDSRFYIFWIKLDISTFTQTVHISANQTIQSYRICTVSSHVIESSNRLSYHTKKIGKTGFCVTKTANYYLNNCMIFFWVSFAIASI